MRDNTHRKLIRHIETALSQAIGGMTGKDLAVAMEDSAAEAPPLEDAIVWEQSFSHPEGPSFWITAGKDLWESLGRITLDAAGIEKVTDEDCRSTWLEILNQTVAGLAAAMTAASAREIAPSRGNEIEAEPPDLEWTPFSVFDGGDRTWPCRAAWTGELAGLCESGLPEAHSPAARDSAVSKTFDLLLEVALPVAVSFGRTSLQIREVLKLSTGSIVELDRFITDPVEVIVNDCVIARGEVVVVDGNYGVRISQLASREDRLRTGIAENARKGNRL